MYIEGMPFTQQSLGELHILSALIIVVHPITKSPSGVVFTVKAIPTYTESRKSDQQTFIVLKN